MWKSFTGPSARISVSVAYLTNSMGATSMDKAIKTDNFCHREVVVHLSNRSNCGHGHKYSNIGDMEGYDA